MTTRLAACSLMLRDGVRWVPDAANELLDAEFTAVEQELATALKSATGGKSADGFVEASLDKIAKDCANLAATIAPGRQVPDGLVTEVKADLAKRLAKNMIQSMAPGVSRSRLQISPAESGREGPWDQVLTLLLSAARMPREIFTDFRRLQGFVTKPDAMVRAFNVFDDPLVTLFLDGRRVDEKAYAELDVIKGIQEHPSAKPKQRAYAVWHLIKGDPQKAITAALTDENTRS